MPVEFHQSEHEVGVSGWIQEPPDVRDASSWGSVYPSLAALPSNAGKKSRVQAEATGVRVWSAPERKRKTATELLERTPHLRLKQSAKRVYLVSVYADTQPPDGESKTEPIKLEIPKNLKRIEVEVWLHHSQHFKILGQDTARISIRKDKPKSSSAEFRVRFANRRPSSPIFLSAMFRYSDRPCGRVFTRLRVTKDGELEFTAARQSKFSKHPQEVDLPRKDRAASIAAEIGARKSDVRIEIVRTEENDGRHFTMKCFTPRGNWSGPWNLLEDSKAIVKAHMDDFKNQTGPQRIKSLEGAGIEFWEIVPPKVRTLLKESIQEGLIKTILIMSEEPYIPWELMIPDGLGDHGALGATFDVGRWVTGDYIAPRQSVKLRTAFVIKPKSNLKHADAEATFLKGIFGSSSEIDPATFEHIDRSLETGGRDAIHLICHGKSGQLQTIRLNSPDVLTSAQVRAMKGFKKAFQSGPLAFLNACEVGSPVPSLVGIGGFANSFIQLGASAVVAPLWAVQDSFAYEVSSSFYKAVLAGSTFAKAVRCIREKAYTTAVDSYAAYCFYGDPLAHVVVS